jgi:hypothetical protein
MATPCHTPRCFSNSVIQFGDFVYNKEIICFCLSQREFVYKENLFLKLEFEIHKGHRFLSVKFLNLFKIMQA